MKTYIKIQFSADGEDPSRIIGIFEELGWKPVVGEYDFVMDGGFGESINSRFIAMLDELNGALKGTGIHYSLYTFP